MAKLQLFSYFILLILKNVLRIGSFNPCSPSNNKNFNRFHSSILSRSTAISVSTSRNNFPKQNNGFSSSLEPSKETKELTYSKEDEPLFSISYDPLEPPNQVTYERDLEDKLLERSLRFYDKSTIQKEETCYLVGLEDRSSFYSFSSINNNHRYDEVDTVSESELLYGDEQLFDDMSILQSSSSTTGNTFPIASTSQVLSQTFSSSNTLKFPGSSMTMTTNNNHKTRKDDIAIKYTLEESLTELSELAGAAGLTVVGSTYQRVSRPSIEYYIGQGKTKEIAKIMQKLKCTCVIFDNELTPSQQKNLEMVLNQDNSKDTKRIKVIDRTALILDIFAQHARTREGQLQVQLALLSYRLPRLTNMWTHLERQSAGSKGRSNGGVGLRGPGEKQLESDKRQMKVKISLLNTAIDSVRRHRSSHRKRRRQLGVPVVALVGYTNAGKSSLLNTMTHTSDVFASDMLFATLDPTTRLVSMSGMQYPDLLMTDTVGFIQKLPTHLVAAFRATLEEISEADVLLHVSDITNDAWRKQEAAVLQELHAMGLENKPLVRVWNKIDLMPDRKEFWKHEASRSVNTVAVSCHTREGVTELNNALQKAICSTMEDVACVIPYTHTHVLSSLHKLGALSEVLYNDEGIFVKGKLPSFLVTQVMNLQNEIENDSDEEINISTTDNAENSDISLVSNIDTATSSSTTTTRDVEEYYDWNTISKLSSNSNTEEIKTINDDTSNTHMSSKNNNNNRNIRKLDLKTSTKQLIQQHAHKMNKNMKKLTEEYDLNKYGLNSDGLLDFDNGEYGHHGVA